MPPPPLQSAARKRDGVEIFADDDGSRRRAWVHRHARERTEHAVADVPQVTGASSEVFIRCCFVAGDFDVDRGPPCAIGASARGDGRKRGLGERLILEHGNLEGQDIGAVARGIGREALQLVKRGGDGMAQGPRLDCRLASAANGAARRLR